MVETGALDIAQLQRSCGSARVGQRIIHLETTDSTNDEAWRRLPAGDADGLVVLAEYQTKGRGRMGRAWKATRGASVLCSVLIEDCASALTPATVGLAAGVALHDAIVDATGLHCVIDWPNDLLIGDRKVAGVLVESRKSPGGTAIYVMGIGINCLQHAGHFCEELAGRATSLDIESDSPISRQLVVLRLLERMDEWFAAPTRWTDADLRVAWLARASPLGRRVSLVHQGQTHRGSIIDLDPVAGLVVQLDSGGVRMFAAADTTTAPAEPPPTG